MRACRDWTDRLTEDAGRDQRDEGGESRHSQVTARALVGMTVPKKIIGRDGKKPRSKAGREVTILG